MGVRVHVFFGLRRCLYSGSLLSNPSFWSSTEQCTSPNVKGGSAALTSPYFPSVPMFLFIRICIVWVCISGVVFLWGTLFCVANSSTPFSVGSRNKGGNSSFCQKPSNSGSRHLHLFVLVGSTPSTPKRVTFLETSEPRDSSANPCFWWVFVQISCGNSCS